MYKRFKILFFIKLSSVLCSACAPQYSGKVPPKVINGEIDLTGWDFEKDGPVKLDGDWLFAWEKFVEPASWQDLQKQMNLKIKIPSKWISLQSENLPPDISKGMGFGSYLLKLRAYQAKIQVFISMNCIRRQTYFYCKRQG